MRPSIVDSDGRKKGAWSEEEDNKLRAYIQRYGHWNWRHLPKFAGLARCGKSCRLRWVNYLKPGVKRGDYSKEEEDLIVQLHSKLGNKWSAIASKVPGRTDNEIKNYWHSHIEKKRNKRNGAETGMIMRKESCKTSSLSQVLQKEQPYQISPLLSIQKEYDVVTEDSSCLQELENSVPSLNNANSIEYDTTCLDSVVEGNFWTQPFQVDYFESSQELEYDDLSFLNPYTLSPPHWPEEDSVSSSDQMQCRTAKEIYGVNHINRIVMDS